MKILIVINLVHASPRIPELIAPILYRDLDVTVLMPQVSDEEFKKLGLPAVFVNKVTFVSTPNPGDIFDWARKLLNIFGFRSSKSYTEQLKSGIGENKGRSHLIDFAMRVYQAFFAFPDTEKKWKSIAIDAFDSQLSNSHYDLVISSSPYPTVHLVAEKIKWKYGIQWIADFRDPWTKSHNYNLPNWRKVLDFWLEKKVIKQANLLTTVSDGFADRLATIHNHDIEVIRNGYRINEQISNLSKDKFVVSYTGTIYAGKQSPSLILHALAELIRSQKITATDLEFNFYGRFDNELDRLSGKLKLNEVVKQKGRVARDQVYQIQADSHLLVMFNWQSPKSHGIFPLKLYEYLGAQRPMIATGIDHTGEVKSLLDYTNSGVVAECQSEVTDQLFKFYQEYKSTGTVRDKSNKARLYEFSYEYSSNKLLNVFKKIRSES